MGDVNGSPLGQFEGANSKRVGCSRESGDKYLGVGANRLNSGCVGRASRGPNLIEFEVDRRDPNESPSQGKPRIVKHSFHSIPFGLHIEW
jgi:hypothetical protein